MRGWAIAPLLCLTASCVPFFARPLGFRCEGDLVRFSKAYPDDPLTAAIRRDAGHDDDVPLPLVESSDADTYFSPGLAEALAARAEKAAEAPRRVLVLSGGGQWGAFGAGFLAERAKRGERYDAVTGVSTGAIQGLFVAAGDIARLRREYLIGDQDEIAKDRGDLAMLTTGARYDTAPLRRKILDFLCPEAETACTGLEHINAENAPGLLIGVVHLAEGTLRVIDVSAMVRAHYRRGAPPLAEARALGECVTGAVMASAAVPAQLRPVQIDKVTYTDGGVRSSVFAAVVGTTLERLRTAERGGPEVEVEVDVIRNGPTVVQRNRDPKHPDGIPPVDQSPDVRAVATQAYATIVNQVEVGSIAALRFHYPTGTIRVIAADGYNSPGNPDRCPRPQRKRVFDPDFMGCLVAWGERRAVEKNGEPDWIVLGQVAPGSGQVTADR